MSGRDRFRELRNRLRGGLFLSSMMGITNGMFCRSRGKGCSMVQLGAYLAEPPAYGKLRDVLPPDPEECVDFFRRECTEARGESESEIVVCLNLATPRLEWGLEAAMCFHRAGGDIVELNVHGGYERYLKLGKLRAMVLPENRTELFRWVEAFSRLDVPIIVKFRMGVIPDYTPVLDRITEYDIFGVHFNIRDNQTKRPNINFVRELKGRYPDMFLLVSGYVRSAADAEGLLNAGADMVGIAEPTIREPNYIHKIAQGLKGV